MPLSVRSCFTQFRRDYVDLDSSETERARASRNYVQSQLLRLEDLDGEFPFLTGDFLDFGSFARKTKIRPLDHIGILAVLDGSGTVEKDRSYDSWRLLIRENQDEYVPLERFSTWRFVNSTEILDQMCYALNTVTIYRTYGIRETMPTITLNLPPYNWNFNIVPGVEIFDTHGNSQHYLIPEGSGNWIRTDPRRDNAFITSINQRHSGLLLGVMRLLKYWNNMEHNPNIPPYYFETLVLKVFESAPKITDYSNALKYFFDNCRSYLWSACPDPQSLGPNLDKYMSRYSKQKVDVAVILASMLTRYAIDNEAQGNHREAIKWWQEVFGQEFPDYGE